MISQREPDAVNPHVRFAERRLETGPAGYRASRRLYPVGIEPLYNQLYLLIYIAFYLMNPVVHFVPGSIPTGELCGLAECV